LGRLVCPRCGGFISWVERRRVGNRIYYYAVHVIDSKRVCGKIVRRIRKCYLGPEKYVYVSKLHSIEGLVLRGLVDNYRLVEYLETITKYVISVGIEPRTWKRIKEILTRTLEKLDKPSGDSNREKTYDPL